jgi:hypothetical protein
MEEVVVSLIDDFKVPCTLLEKTRVPDGEGGWSVAWKDGMKFTAAITNPNTIESRVAEKEGMTSTFTVTTEKNMGLDFHDVFRRDTDGDIFRVTSDSQDKMTPDRASFQFSQVSAEKWSLT